MLRAAELALQHDFPYFVVMGGDVRFARDSDASPLEPVGDPRSGLQKIKDAVKDKEAGKVTPVLPDPRSGGDMKKASAFTVVQCFREAPTDGQAVRDARAISRAIRSKYGLH